MSNGSRQTTGGSSSSASSVRAPQFLQPSIQAAGRGALESFVGFNEAPTASSARNLVQQSLDGDFLTPDSNPFLQKTFDIGADTIQRRLDSQFAGAGRNLGASQPVAADELGSFGARLFGDNFQRERDRQVQSIFGESAVNPLDQLIRRNAAIGQTAGSDITTTGTNSQEVEDKASPLDRALGLLSIF